MRRGMRVAFGLVLLLCILIGGGYAFMSQASFGKLPEGERLDAISQSPHYEGGAFRNTEPLPPIKGNGGIVGALMKYVFPSLAAPADAFKKLNEIHCGNMASIMF